MSKAKIFGLAFFYIIMVSLIGPQDAYAMHIAEGFLPIKWAGIWMALTLPFLLVGIKSIQKKVSDKPELKMLLGLAGAFAFILSALKIPSITGSCSHPTGVGLGAILFGPTAMTVLGTIVLIFQAVLLAHGGLTTLGANAFSMAVVGPFVAFGVYKLLQKIGISRNISVFCAAALGDLLTYIVTATQLALAYSGEGFMVALSKFMGVFAITQIPLAISEGILTVIVFNILANYSQDELKELSVLNKEVNGTCQKASM